MWGWIYWAGKPHRAKSKLVGKYEVACAECVIPVKLSSLEYKSSQAQGEEDSCWASNTFLERIKAIQSSSLFPDYL